MTIVKGLVAVIEVMRNDFLSNSSSVFMQFEAKNYRDVLNGIFHKKVSTVTIIPKSWKRIPDWHENEQISKH